MIEFDEMPDSFIHTRLGISAAQIKDVETLKAFDRCTPEFENEMKRISQVY